VAKAIDLDIGIFYSGLYGDIDTNVLVRIYKTIEIFLE
jgi:hypothetical protein